MPSPSPFSIYYFKAHSSNRGDVTEDYGNHIPELAFISMFCTSCMCVLLHLNHSYYVLYNHFKAALIHLLSNYIVHMNILPDQQFIMISKIQHKHINTTVYAYFKFYNSYTYLHFTDHKNPISGRGEPNRSTFCFYSITVPF